MNEIQNHITEQIDNTFNEISDKINEQEHRLENLNLLQAQFIKQFDEYMSAQNRQGANWILFGNKLYDPNLIEKVCVLKNTDSNSDILRWGIFINQVWQYFYLTLEEGYELLNAINGDEVFDLGDYMITTPQTVDDDSSTFNLIGITISPQSDPVQDSESIKETDSTQSENISLDHKIIGGTFRELLKIKGYNKNRYPNNYLQHIVNEYTATTMESSWNIEDFERFLLRHFDSKKIEMIKNQEYDFSFKI